MSRIDPGGKRPRIQPRPKERIEDPTKGAGRTPEHGDRGPSMTVAGFDTYHRLTRGTNSRTWGDGEKAPPAKAGTEGSRSHEAPDPVRPGAKGDHGGISLPLDAPIVPADDEAGDEAAKKKD